MNVNRHRRARISAAPRAAGAGASRGFSLIELLVVVTIVAILLMLCVPSFFAYLQTSQVRNAAEGVINGIGAARIEAMKRNRVVELQFDDLPKSGWTLRDPFGAATTVASRGSNDGSRNVQISVSPPGAFKITFDPLGRVVPNSDGSAAISRVDLASNMSADATAIAVLVRAGGAARMCVPDAPASAVTSCS